jgi:hypothetical protein
MNRITIILIIASLLTGGIFSGGFFCGKATTSNVASVSKKDSIRVVHIVDTLVKYKTEYFEAPGQIIYIPVSGDSSEKTACWDTTTSDGFSANIKYSITRNLFKNRFTLPEKTINHIDSILVYSEKTTTIIENEFPHWELGIGAKCFYQDSKFQYFPYLDLTFNQKVWFMDFSIEGKALTQFDSGGIKMIPEINAAIKFSL